jgi:hypothetical protein
MALEFERRRYTTSWIAASCVRYRYFLLGILGWVLLIANYPFGWQLPKYAEF